jgi:ABC-2 type transport system permease protein
MTFVIAWREFKTLFLSPLAWSVLAVVQAILALLFLGGVQEVLLTQAQVLAMENAPGVTERIVPQLFGSAAVVFILVTPLLTMRLVAEERRQRTLPLLFSAPISMTEIILGKYLGALLFLLIFVATIAVMPLSLLVGGRLDVGLLAASMMGLALTLASFAAIGLFASTLTQNPFVAAILGFGILLLFWIADYSGQGDIRASVLAYVSLANHYVSFLKGSLDTTSVAYHVLIVITFLVLGIRRLDADRLGA